MSLGFQRLIWLCLALSCATPVAAQVRLDRADPTITVQTLPTPTQDSAADRAAPTLSAPDAVSRSQQRNPTVIPSAIVVDGGVALSPPDFARVVVDFVGRPLESADLSKLAGAVASLARSAGYPFATATIAPQPLTDGVLHVTLDEGRIDAVRVIGAINPQADRILTHALVSSRPLRLDMLERAIALVGDLPGVTVKESRFTRQDGFGILLVTIAQDRLTAYAQADNRGNSEVGPVRSTVLASARSVLASGDELSVLLSQTPLQPAEFFFVRTRYSAPVDARGSVVSASASYGRAHPGASLLPLNVIGHSYDAAVTVTTPLVRTRQKALNASLEFRGIRSEQSLRGIQLRDDRLATLTASLGGVTPLAGGIVRGDVSLTAGLPLPGVSEEGFGQLSRVDGDARFLTIGYFLDWVARLDRKFSFSFSSTGQLASRPLLATAEIGLGGPAFGRGYDNSERTGDNGILGAAEFRADLGRVVPGAVDRLQLYGFVDGGYVTNLRGGLGGGALASSGGGARIGTGKFDAMIEVAQPLNAPRFDTGDKRPRVTVRVSRGF
ncbi:MAG: ShlB/FhaC/HecB family hemolysin secretion/activation protein [Sphingomonas sp.]